MGDTAMDTKLDSRQGQFPATFPDTFKDFFAMMSEDEDHLDLFSNLLEDKVIPRTSKLTPRRYGGSLRCTTNASSQQSTSGSAGGNINTTGRTVSGGRGSSQQNVGRSNSFRVNRPRHVFSSGSGSGLNKIQSVEDEEIATSENVLCKHVKYCCLHQQQQHQQQLQQQQQQQQKLNYFNPHHHSRQDIYQHDYICSSTRLGPDGGEDNNECNRQAGVGDVTAAATSIKRDGQIQQHKQNQQQQQPQQQQQKRHSIILERAFDFDVSCDESDTISTTSSTPTATNIPYNILKPILKQPQQQLPNQKQQQQQQQPIIGKNSMKMANKDSMPSRMLPQPPRGLGAYHSKDMALKRIQQQSGFFSGSRTNLAALSGGCSGACSGAGTGAGTCCGMMGSTANIAASSSGCVACDGATTNIVHSGELNTAINSNLSNNPGNNNFYNSNNSNNSNYNCGMTKTSGVGADCARVDDEQGAVGGSAGDGGGVGSSALDLNLDLRSPTAHLAAVKRFNDFLTADANAASGFNSSSGGVGGFSTTGRGNFNNIRAQTSPLNRRRSSSIVANLLGSDTLYEYNRSSNIATTPTTMEPTADDINNKRSHALGGMGAGAAISGSTITLSAVTAGTATTAASSGAIAGIYNSNTSRDRISLAKSPVAGKPTRLPSIPVEGGVLTFQQAMSGAVSPLYPTSHSPLLYRNGGSTATGLDMLGSSTALASVLECNDSSGPFNTDSPTEREDNDNGEDVADDADDDDDDDDDADADDDDEDDSPTNIYNKRELGNGATAASIAERAAAVVGNWATKTNKLHGSSATIAQLGNKQKQRMRTSSMPAESRKPRLADTRRSAIHCADLDLEYYRLRSFSITSHGVCNLGDSLRSRRSRSINSVTSTGTSNSGKDRHNSNASRTSGDMILEQTNKSEPGQVPAYKVAMLGASGVGKTTLTYQFTTSDYICAYDLSLDDDYGQKSVSVLLDGIETDLEIIDHPSCEMSTEAFCSTYNIDLFVVVYSVVDRSSFKAAEKVLQYLKENEMLLTRGAILVGNKTDLERHREVNRQMARKLAKEIACKFIETSSGLDHNVDELLVGIVAQVKLNPQRIRNLSERDRQRLNLQSTIQKHRRMHLPTRRQMVRQLSMCHDDDAADFEKDNAEEGDENNGSVFSPGDEGVATCSERTGSTSLSSGTLKSVTKGPVRKNNKRTLNLESILKMGESELEDEEDSAHRQQNRRAQTQTRTLSKFEFLTSGCRSRTPFSSVNSSPRVRPTYESSVGGRSARSSVGSFTAGTQFHDSQAEENLLNDCQQKTAAVTKLTNRTKVFLSSVLRFKKAINVKRRNSSSCSDLFVI